MNIIKAPNSLSLAGLNQIAHQSRMIREWELIPFRSMFDQLVDQLTIAKMTDIKDCVERGNMRIIEDHSLFLVVNDPLIELAHDWLRTIIQYNVPRGKLFRGLSLTINYQILVDGYEQLMNRASSTISNHADHQSQQQFDTLTDNARLLGWCVEMFQAYFLVLDDMMDNSITRRGQPCWYRKVSSFVLLYSLIVKCFMYTELLLFG